MIVSGGENVWPGPVEEVLRSLPGVADAAVAGVDDPEWGQRVVAWIVPAESASPPSLRELRGGVAENLAPFAAPRQMILVKSLPRTSIGKVRRQELSLPDDQTSHQ
jgi:o-succinylbenzoate---CoA ligase